MNAFILRVAKCISTFLLRNAQTCLIIRITFHQVLLYKCTSYQPSLMVCFDDLATSTPARRDES
jgi:hypothetical protein